MIVKIVSYVLLGVVVFLALRNKKNTQRIKDFLFDHILDKYLLPELKVNHNAITRSSIENLKDYSSFSDKILLRDYRHIEDDFGVFQLCTERRGIGFELVMPPIATEDLSNQIRRIVQEFDGIRDLVVEIKTISSKNIDWYCQDIAEVASCKTKLKNASILARVRDDHIKKLKNWADKDSMSVTRFFARDIRTFIFILFPPNFSIEKIHECFKHFKSAIDGLIALTPDELVILYNEILKSDHSAITHDIFQPMNKQIARGIKVDISDRSGVIKLGEEKYAQVLTTLKYPAHTTATDVQNCFFPFEGARQYPISGSFMASLTIHFEDTKILGESILKKAKRNLTSLGSFFESKEGGKQSMLSPNLRETFEESKEIIDNINAGEKLSQAFYSIVIFEDSREKLRQTCEAIKGSFLSLGGGGWHIKEEDMPLSAFMCFLHALPLNFESATKKFIDRYDLFFSSNISACMPLLGTFKGDKAVMKFFNRSGQVCGLDFFSGQNNYNCNIIGQSGTGKSFLTNSIAMSYLQTQTKVVIFDIGKSYKPLCDLLGGEYIVFDDTKPICLNFFTNATTRIISAEELRQSEYLEFADTKISAQFVCREDGNFEVLDEDALESCLKIVGAMVGTKFSGISAGVDVDVVLSRSIIQNALKIAFLTNGRDAGMHEVYLALEKMQMDSKEANNMPQVNMINAILSGIAPYSKPDGDYFKYFNGANNIKTDSDFTLIETEELAGKTLYDIVYIAMLGRITQDCFFDRSQRKIIIFDECRPLLAHDVIAPYLDDFSRRLRKYNASMITITQNPDDFEVSASARAIWQNSDFKLILPVKDVSKYFTQDRIFSSLNSYQQSLLKNTNSFTPHYSEITAFIGNVTEIFRLKATPLQYAIFTTNPEDNKKRLQYQREHGLTLNQSYCFYAYVLEGKYSVQEILEKVKSEDDENEENWLVAIKNAIKEERVIPYAYPLVDKDGEIETFEILLKIQTQIDGTEFVADFEAFRDVAIENRYSYLLKQQLAKKTLALAKEHGIKALSFELDLIELHENYFSYLGGIFEKFEGVVILEISVSKLNRLPKEQVIGFKEALGAYSNIKLVLSDVDFSFNLEWIEMLKPNSLKISTKIFKGFDNIAELEMFCKMGDVFGVGLIVTGIDTRSKFEVFKNVGFDYFQGDIFSLSAPAQEAFSVTRQNEGLQADNQAC